MPEVIVHDGQVVIHPPQQFYAGDSWLIDAFAENADGTRLDLTGAYVEWRLADATLLNSWLILTIGNGISIDPAETSHAIITASSDQTNRLPAGYYRDQFTIRTSDGIVSTQFQGRIQVVPRISGTVVGSAKLAGAGDMANP